MRDTQQPWAPCPSCMWGDHVDCWPLVLPQYADFRCPCKHLSHVEVATVEHVIRLPERQ